MCLNIINKPAPKRTCIVYKVFRKLSNNEMTAPFIYAESFRFRKGKVYKSDRNGVQLNEIEMRSLSVDRGIHVYTSKAIAILDWSLPYKDFVLVKCKALPKHFVAYGTNNEAVYTEITLIEQVKIKKKKD